MKTVKSFAKIIIALLMALALTTLTACDVLNDFFGKGSGGEGPGGETTHHVMLYLDGGELQNDFISYTEGRETSLPEPKKDYYDFGGWYENPDKSGTAVTKIPSTATDDKTYYAKWTPKTYSITYYVNDKVTTNTPNSYTYGVGATLPTPNDDNYEFSGWHKDSISGEVVTRISTTDHGDKKFYATSVGATFNVKFNLNGGTLDGGDTTTYTFGVGLELPTPTNTNTDLKFAGWYTAKSGGTKVTAITSTDSGDKQYWARWTEKGAIEATFGGYEEGAYVELAVDKSVSLDDIEVSYKSNGGSSKTLTGDDKTYLVRRISDDTVRADIVGIKNGTCEITVTVSGETISDTVNITNYDRSGYAHFDSSASDKVYATGVGGYNNDGTPKSGAEIIYVTEANKNSVSGSYLISSDGVGLVSVLKYSYRSRKPVIIRIIGRIAAPTWEHDDHDHQMIEYTKASSKITSKEIIDQTKSKFGITLSAKSYTQDQLTDLGFNLEKGITPLNGLSSSMTVASDTCWNDCSIGGSSSKAKNVTVEGIGADAVIFQWGMTWKYASSIEIRNLTFTDYTEDACSFEGGTSATSVDKFDSQRIWVHNCTFNRGKSYWDLTDEQDKHDGDGATDFKRAAYITVAYNNYYNNHKTGLIGSDDNVTTANVTFHHNFYEICESRLPLARQANMHMYNNYYYGSTGTNMSIRSGAYAFVEACYFENAANPIVTQLGKEDKLLSGYGRLDGYAKAYNCTFTGKQVDTKNYNVTITSSRNATVKNDNIFDDQFDLDSNKFYLNSDGATKVTLLTDASQARFDCVNYAGAHKPSGYVMIATESTLKAYHDSRKIK